MELREIYSIKGDWKCEVPGSVSKTFEDMTYSDAFRAMRTFMDGGYASVGQRILSEEPITVDVIGDFWSFTVTKIG